MRTCYNSFYKTVYMHCNYNITLDLKPLNCINEYGLFLSLGTVGD